MSADRLNTDADRTSVLRRLGLLGFVAAVVGGAATAFGYVNERESFYAAYLTALIFWLNLSLGSMAVAMVHGLSGGGWGTTVRRVVEAGFETLPIMALAFVPVWLDVGTIGPGAIYEWADPAVMQHSEVLMRKIDYLNVEAWRIRAIILFALWLLTAAALHFCAPATTSVAGVNESSNRRSQKLQAVSGAGLFIYVFAVTVAAVDWVMSLEPHWFSTMYGVLYLAAQAVAGLSLAIILVTRFAHLDPWRRLLTPDRLNDLGNLLLAFTMFWAYVQLMQFLIIWSADLPEENVWYIRRAHGVWLPISWVLIGFSFAAPFLLLLSRRRKRNATDLGRVAMLLLPMTYLNAVWMTMPGFEHADHSGTSHGMSHGPSAALLWLAPATFAAIGGVWTMWFAWRLAARCRVPLYDGTDLEVKEGADEHAGRTVAG